MKLTSYSNVFLFGKIYPKQGTEKYNATTFNFTHTTKHNALNYLKKGTFKFTSGEGAMYEKDGRRVTE